jgi:hypothetical protein
MGWISNVAFRLRPAWIDYNRALMGKLKYFKNIGWLVASKPVNPNASNF